MLTRRKALAYRIKPAVPAEVKELLSARAGAWCEMALEGCTGQGIDPSHRIGRAVGGGDGLANLVWACRRCHGWCHANPLEAKLLGLMLESWQNPLVEPLTYRNERRVLLDDLGYVWPVASRG